VSRAQRIAGRRECLPTRSLEDPSSGNAAAAASGNARSRGAPG